MQISGLQNKILDVTQMGSNFNVSIRVGQGLDQAFITLPEAQVVALKNFLIANTTAIENQEDLNLSPEIPTYAGEEALAGAQTDSETEGSDSVDASTSGDSLEAGSLESITEGAMGNDIQDVLENISNDFSNLEDSSGDATKQGV